MPGTTREQSVILAYSRTIENQMAQMPVDGIEKRSYTLAEWLKHAPQLRAAVVAALGLPPGYERMPPPAYEVRSVSHEDGYTRLKLIFQSETNPNSWVTALLYLPADQTEAVPAMVFASGHGGSKSTTYNQIAAQIYVRLGCAVLVIDPLGQEERHPSGLPQIRGHREGDFLDRAFLAGRPFVGKVVLDHIRSIDLLQVFPGIDATRIGCAGSSLGGTVSQLLAAVDQRLSVCVNSAWAADYRTLDGMKGCCYRLPGLMQAANQCDLFALGAPHCATLVAVGAIDDICPPTGAERMVEAARRIYSLFGAEEKCRLFIHEGRGHQPYHISPAALEWVGKHFGLAPDKLEWVRNVGRTTLGAYADAHGIAIEKLYDVEKHHCGAVMPDIDAVVHPAQDLGILREEERRFGPFTHFSWLQAVERGLPRLPATYAQMAAWLHARPELLARLRALLVPPPYRLEWGEGEEVNATAGWAPPAGCRLFRHTLGAPGFTAYSCWPADTPAPATAVVYLPRSRNKDAIDPQRVQAWLKQRRAVAILDAACLNDNEVLLGCTATAFNVALIRCAVDGLTRRLPSSRIEVYGEVDDTAVWAVLLDSRISLAEVAARAGSEPSRVTPFRREGIVPGLARYTDTAGLWALAGKRVRLTPGIARPDELERLELARQVEAAMEGSQDINAKSE
jgi:dienelactone hydrolase